jgi:AbrB family looped-hinge helix DNA binding protein
MQTSVKESNEKLHRLEGSAVRLVTIGAKGRVTIPAKLRERFGLKTGTFMDWSVEQGRLVLTLQLRSSVETNGQDEGERRTSALAVLHWPPSIR